VTNTNLPTILHHFQVMADYVKCSLATGRSLKLEGLSYQVVKTARTIICSFVWTKHRNVTDAQTDRQTDRQADGQISSSYYSGRHCKQCGRAVKTDAWCHNA